MFVYPEMEIQNNPKEERVIINCLTHDTHNKLIKLLTYNNIFYPIYLSLNGNTGIAPGLYTLYLNYIKYFNKKYDTQECLQFCYNHNRILQQCYHITDKIEKVQQTDSYCIFVDNNQSVEDILKYYLNKDIYITVNPLSLDYTYTLLKVGQKIFVGGKFHHPIDTEDIRSKIFGSINIQVDQIPFKENIYIGPFFSIKASEKGGFITDHQDKVIEEEMDMIKRCDKFYCIFLEQSPGTLIELSEAVKLNKNITIITNRDFAKENWYAFRFAQLRCDNVSIVFCETEQEVINYFNDI